MNSRGTAFTLRSNKERSAAAGVLVTALLLISTPLLAKPKEGGPTPASTPIAITSDDSQVWVVNPDNDSVSALEVAGHTNRKVAEIDVGREPRFLAITAKDNRVFVSNSRSGTV